MIQNTVLVIGLGETGKPLANLLKKSYKVIEKDIAPSSFRGSIDVMHICYPFSKNFIQMTLKYITEFKPKLAIINSTVSPGTSREIYRLSKIPVAYSPIRGKHKKMNEDLLKYTKFIAAINDDTQKIAETHFEKAGFKVSKLNPLEALELAKLLETTYFGLLIAWTQEMERYCQKFGVDYYQVMEFTKEIDYLPRVIFRPGYIGGHCVIPNLSLLKNVLDSQFLKIILESNEKKGKQLRSEGKSLKKRISPIKI